MGGGGPVDRIKRKRVTRKDFFSDKPTELPYETGIEGYEQ